MSGLHADLQAALVRVADTMDATPELQAIAAALRAQQHVLERVSVDQPGAVVDLALAEILRTLADVAIEVLALQHITKGR